MGYSKEIMDKAQQVLENRRNRAENEIINRKEKLTLKASRISIIENELNSTAIKAGRAVLGGGDVKQQLQHLQETNTQLLNEQAQILSTFDLPSDYFEPKYFCEVCSDKGYVEKNNQTVMCSCLRDLLKAIACEELNKLSPLSLSSFDTFSLEFYSKTSISDNTVSSYKRMEDIFHFCKDYAANFTPNSKSLLFQGATGIGKTHLSLAIARAVINKGYGVVYVSAPDILSKLEKEHFSYRNEEQSEGMLTNCDLLILDDLGTEFSTQFSSAAVHNILNKRLLLNKPTIISTNLTIQEMEKFYSARFVSRIIGNHLRLQFLGNDVRQKKRLIK
ncbi:MAG: ATP-binding protein [Bacillota bacterium]|nr:ATP-binding protein [Bacillota bacterium]